MHWYTPASEVVNINERVERNWAFMPITVSVGSKVDGIPSLSHCTVGIE